MLEPIELVTEKDLAIEWRLGGGCVVRAFNQHAFAELAAGSGATKTRYDFALAQGPGKALALRPGFKVIWL